MTIAQLVYPPHVSIENCGFAPEALPDSCTTCCTMTSPPRCPALLLPRLGEHRRCVGGGVWDWCSDLLAIAIGSQRSDTNCVPEIELEREGVLRDSGSLCCANCLQLFSLFFLLFIRKGNMPSDMPNYRACHPTIRASCSTN
jgi:hypothetical protein